MQPHTLSLALLASLGLMISPVLVQSGPTDSAINLACANAMQPQPCLDLLHDNLDVRTPEVDGVPEMSLQVAAKIAKEAGEFAAAANKTKKSPPSKCLADCAGDIDKVAKEMGELPAAIKPGDEAGVLPFIEGFKRVCGDDCPAATERSADEQATWEKFNGVMKALGVVQDLFMTKKEKVVEGHRIERSPEF
ncbi:uncharacterized protein LOC104583086 [Brachypodium distachyon]|uniref:uncharacterized protein LOC104583086 n=1 Tax=Brachypodium distachyon TaxID=15368 RepID=UPI0005300812|nr:uncharacterized protein LOC104583086 [Brachypodium distachyon]|eukprot:XP_010233107.1 uncharacterized protein LOC104583086 [Brachypodium distachyon]